METVDLALRSGFAVRSERGGRSESFGNVLVEFERPPLALRLTRDRGQWTIDIAPDGRAFQALHVLLAAKSGQEPWLADGEPFREQWPHGVRWKIAVPDLLQWLEDSDRSDAIRLAHEQWVALLRQRYGPG